ncbi:BamA/TamA family outer membrane protein [Robertkochia aurantiaca]|uniref:BamA/TamA family outer membrane protein n=1 Tax=Robertkochia aurantiaca TaxID=2873700 RepID=UPI001CCFA9C4|nr:hypothetical protein [Robertkochia sp. 3YJGBD-33]
MVLCVILPAFLWSQSSYTLGDNALKSDKLYLIPLPVISYDPAYGFVFGASGTGNMLLGNKEDTRLSSGIVSVTYSSFKQLVINLRSNIYTRHDKWVLMGDWRYMLSSQPTYGLGTGPQSDILLNEERDGFELGDYRDGVNQAELMEFRLLRIHETFLRQIGGGFYFGIGYHLDKYRKIEDDLLDLSEEPPVITNHFAYSRLHDFNPKDYVVSGLSVNALFDTRDNINNPVQGRYAFLQFRVLPTWLGSSRNATSLWLEYRDYFSVNKEVPRNIIALWFYSSFMTSGRLPYMGLPAIGWDQFSRSGRAYPQGRFRGENLFYSEVEYRFRLPLKVKIPFLNKQPNHMGGVLFANMTSASASDLNTRLLEYLKPGLGFGLRFMMNKETRSNITCDYGIGTDGKGAFYFGLNEYF